MIFIGQRDRNTFLSTDRTDGCPNISCISTHGPLRIVLISLPISLALLIYSALFNLPTYAQSKDSSAHLTERLSDARITGRAQLALKSPGAVDSRPPLPHIRTQSRLSPHIDFHSLVGVIRSRHPISPKAEALKEAIYAPAPSDLEFTLVLPAQPVFTFYPAAFTDRHTNPSNSKPITYEVLIKEEADTGSPASIFRQAYTLKQLASGWNRPVELALPRHSGRRVKLILRTYQHSSMTTSPPKVKGLHSAWAAPLIYSRKQRGKTIVLILFDTLSAKRTGINSDLPGATPNLARLADSSVTFTRAFSTSPWTLPSFASLVTGLPPGKHRAGEFMKKGPSGHRPISSTAILISEALRRRGWHTEAWVNNPFLHYLFGTARGFSEFTMYNRLGLRNEAGPAVELVRSSLAQPASTDRFILFHIMDPHSPYYPPDEYVRRYVDRCEDMPDLTLSPCDLKPYWHALRPGFAKTLRPHVQQLHAAAVRYADDEVTKLYSLLREAQFTDDDLLAAITADHGEEFWEHDRFEHGHSQYNELLHVPLVLFGGKFTKPQKIDTPVSLQDVVPTLLDFAGVPHDLSDSPSNPALSLSRHLTEQSESSTQRWITSSHTVYGNERAAVQGERWKYIFNSSRKLQQYYRSLPVRGRYELYDLMSDPGEQKNVFEGNRQMADQLHERLEEQLIDSFAPGYFIIYSDKTFGPVAPVVRLKLSGDQSWDSRGPTALIQPAPSGTAESGAFTFTLDEEKQGLTLPLTSSRILINAKALTTASQPDAATIHILNAPANLRVWTNCKEGSTGAEPGIVTPAPVAGDTELLLDCLNRVRVAKDFPVLALMFLCEDGLCKKEETQELDDNDGRLTEELQSLGYIE